MLQLLSQLSDDDEEDAEPDLGESNDNAGHNDTSDKQAFQHNPLAGAQEFSQKEVLLMQLIGAEAEQPQEEEEEETTEEGTKD